MRRTVIVRKGNLEAVTSGGPILMINNEMCAMNQIGISANHATGCEREQFIDPDDENWIEEVVFRKQTKRENGSAPPPSVEHLFEQFSLGISSDNDN